MKHMVAFLACCVALTALNHPSRAKEETGVTPLLVAPSSLKKDIAYILIRTSVAKSGLFLIQHVLLRVPAKSELDRYRSAKKAAYEAALPDLTKKSKAGKVPSYEDFDFIYKGQPNAFAVDAKKFIQDGQMRTVLFEAPPGTYILYGITIGNRFLPTCNCMGTVSFNARPGVITDVGSLFADKVDKPSPIPHLEDNLGPSMSQYGFVLGEALVPPEKSTEVPEQLSNLPREIAEFEIVQPYLEPGAAGINRLAPIPGLLGYKRGKPTDLRKTASAEH